MYLHYTTNLVYPNDRLDLKGQAVFLESGDTAHGVHHALLYEDTQFTSLIAQIKSIYFPQL